VRAALLGPLEVTREGERVEPTSPKQRALLIDLLVHRGQVLGRDRLIDDLWGDDPPATAPGVLQNYVSQLRRALGTDAVRTVGSGYAAGDGLVVDVDELETHLERARAAHDGGDTEGVRQATIAGLALWRGDPLADVAFEQFAQAEAHRLTEVRGLVLELQLEAEIAAGRHDSATASLESAVTDNPLRERLWWLLMLALYRSGRQADALRAYQRARTILGEELGIEPGEDLRNLEQAILEQRVDVGALLAGRSPRRAVRRASSQPTVLVGREREWSTIESFLDGTDGTAGGLLLLAGEPGIGKTRLLEETGAHITAEGGVVVAGRAFEAEHSRPYGAWIDGLRGAPLAPVDERVLADLAPLLPELSDEAVELEDPNRLYDAVVQVLVSLARTRPVVVLLDDVHWLDEASVALLHFAVRHLQADDVAFVATARGPELEDNSACRRVLETLRRDGALSELAVGPLAAATIAVLTDPIAPGADSARIAEATHGNPLFAVEMARALARGDDPLSMRIDALIGDRLARLDEGALALVPWVAAYGRGVPPRLLAAMSDSDPRGLFAALGDLERHGVLRADENGDVDFVHDLVRGVAYRELSAARRTTLHAGIAAVLAAQPDADDSLAADTARHADAAGDSETCAKACVRAGQRCVRLLAYGDAEEIVALGRTHARRLEDRARIHTDLELIHVLLHPGIRLRDPGELSRDLAELCAEAERLGLDADLSAGLNLISRAYHWGWGDTPRARALMERAFRLIETSEVPDAEPLLEGARCLAYLEIDMPRTARLFDELGVLHALVEHSVQYQWGLGLVDAWRGDVAAARRALATAIELATVSTDHWIAFECTARLALLELEAGDVEAAGHASAMMPPLADKLGEGSEQAYADGVVGLCELASGAPHGAAHVDDAVARLEQIDARFLVPDLLGIAAEYLVGHGHLDEAHARAVAAAEVADEVARPFEAARARALLAAIAATRGDDDQARLHLGRIPAEALPGHVQGLRDEAQRLTMALEAGSGGNWWP
jgi:DNA-binding SARP family transcriptional activator